MKYCVLYPDAQNVHLIKDVGMIAYKMNKLYGADSFVACYENGSYDYLENEVKGLKIDFIEKKHKHIFNIYEYLKSKAKDIDVLQIFHITLKSVIYAFLYKHFNKRGTIFLKLDCSDKLVLKLKNLKIFERIVLDVYLSKVDIIGVEQEEIFKKFKSMLIKFQDKLVNIPNGLDFDKEILSKKIDYNKKKNVIINVGRIGSPEKASDMLMKAFKNIDEDIRRNWKLIFVGPIEDEFKGYIDEFFNKYPKMKESIIFKGSIYDRKLLFQQYRNAKIFCLTSKYESFAFSLIEAGALGNVIVSTDVGIAAEIVKAHNGKLVPFDDVDALSDSLSTLIKDDDIKHKGMLTEEIVRDKYDWNKITKTLYKKLIEIRSKNQNE